MGKLSQGILGQMTGKVGATVGSTWKGINTLRIYQPQVANPRTTAQTANRTAFKTASQFASALTAEIIKPLNDRFAVRMSGNNMWLQRNKSQFNAAGPIAGATFINSQGSLHLPTTFTATPGADYVEFSWSTENGANGAATDQFYLTLMAEGKPDVFGKQFGTRGTGATTPYTLSTKGFSSGDKIIVSASFRRADGTMVSDTITRRFTAL